MSLYCFDGSSGVDDDEANEGVLETSLPFDDEEEEEEDEEEVNGDRIARGEGERIGDGEIGLEEDEGPERGGGTDGGRLEELS